MLHSVSKMAYGRRKYTNRRRVGNKGRVYNGKVLQPVPFKRKRPGNPGAALRYGRRVRRKIGTKLFQTGRKTGQNSSVSFCSLGKKFPSRLDKALYTKVQGRQSLVECNSNRATSVLGEQAVTAFFMNGAAELEAMRDIANLGVSTENDVIFWMGHSKLSLHLRNQTNTNCKLTLYDISVKRNAFSSTYDTPIEAWDKGYLDMNAALTSHSKEVGATPFKSPEFRLYFKVQKVTTMNLEPGMEHEHTVIQRLNRRVTSTEFANRGSTFYFKNLTHFTLAVFHGSLVHESATPATVSYAAITLDYAWRKESNFGYLRQNVPSMTYQNSITKAIVDTDFMGEDADIDTNVASA